MAMYIVYVAPEFGCYFRRESGILEQCAMNSDGSPDTFDDDWNWSEVPPDSELYDKILDSIRDLHL